MQILYENKYLRIYIRNGEEYMSLFVFSVQENTPYSTENCMQHEQKSTISIRKYIGEMMMRNIII